MGALSRDLGKLKDFCSEWLELKNVEAKVEVSKNNFTELSNAADETAIVFHCMAC